MHEEFLLIGFSSLFYQWIIATIIARKIKNALPKQILIIGGFGTKNEASAFLKNFKYFDFVSWGEGEHSLRLTCEILTQGGDIHQIPNTLSSDNVISPKIQPLQYSNIDELKFFNERLMLLGYLEEDKEHYNKMYSLKKTYSYSVSEEFPKIIKSHLPIGVYNTSYFIELSAVENFTVEMDEITQNI